VTLAELKVCGSGEGEAFWFLDTLMQVKLGAAETGGSIVVMEQLAPPGSATPMHRHGETDEQFYVIDGRVDFHDASGVRPCETGTFVSVPRGTPHAFRVSGDAPARLLVLTTTPHFERFVRAVSVAAPALTLPPAAPPPSPEAVAQLAAVGAGHDVEILGPPPA
jgi:mannose-6-phosphate isomerase-like protein (cupin superfamily)